MKKHKDAIKNIRRTLMALTELKRDAKKRILELKFDTEGKRRPETGPQRDAIWQEYAWCSRPRARAAHLALGLLKGRPYKALEAKHAEDSPPPLYGILQLIVESCADDPELRAEWTFDRIKTWAEESSASAQEAA